MIKYPTSLPTALISSNSIQHNPTFSRANHTSGRTRQRKQHNISTSYTSFRFIMTSAQVLEFEEWFTQINNGADWFLMPRLTPNGFEYLKCRFKSIYKGANFVADDRWAIEFEGEVYTHTIGGDWWLLPEWVIDDCGKDTTCILDCVINEIWPPLFPQYVRNKCIIDCAINKEWPQYE